MIRSATQRQRFRLSPAFLIISAAGVSTFGFLVWYVSPAALIRVVGDVDPGLLAVAWLITLAATVVRTVRYALFISVAGRPVQAYAAFSLSRLVNFALPFRTGEVAMLAILKKAGLARTIAETIPAWVVLRMTDALAFSVWFIAIAGLTYTDEHYKIVGLVALSVSVLLLVLLQFSHRWVPKSLIGRNDNWFYDRISAAIAGLVHIRSARKKMFAALLAIAIWGMLISSSVYTQWAFGSPLPAVQAGLVSILVLGAALLPINAPMGVGTGDILWTAVLVFAGIPFSTAVPMALGIRFSMVAILLIEGALGAALLSYSSAKAVR